MKILSDDQIRNLMTNIGSGEHTAQVLRYMIKPTTIRTVPVQVQYEPFIDTEDKAWPTLVISDNGINYVGFLSVVAPDKITIFQEREISSCDVVKASHVSYEICSVHIEPDSPNLLNVIVSMIIAYMSRVTGDHAEEIEVEIMDRRAHFGKDSSVDWLVRRWKDYINNDWWGSRELFTDNI